MASSWKIKLSAGMRPYVGRVVRNGRVQQAFAEQIGRPVGNCVKGAVSPGMGSGQIKAAVSKCAKDHGRTKLNLGGSRGFLGRGYGTYQGMEY